MKSPTDAGFATAGPLKASAPPAATSGCESMAVADLRIACQVNGWTLNQEIDMVIALENVITLATFTSGRRIYALRKARETANLIGRPDLVQRIDTALVDDRETRALDNRWAGSRGTPIYSSDVPQIDNWVDQLLTSIRDAAASFTKGAFAGTSRQLEAERFLKAAFPNGVQAITSLPYIDQVAAVEVLLGQMQSSLGAQISALGLIGLVERLAELTAQYRVAVDQGREELDFATVQASRRRGQRNLLEVVAMIIGAYYSHTDADHMARRDQLLAPIMEQDKAIRALMSARRAVSDIDPDADAGAEDAPAEDAPAEAAQSGDGAAETA